MKKSILIAVLAVATIFTTSCSKDDGAAPITIESTLTTSKQAYKNASDGDWIEVTKEEYDNLATTLNEVNKVGTPDSLYVSGGNSGNHNFTLSNVITGNEIPKNSYIFAFKYFAKSSSTAITDFKVKHSAKINTDYKDLGNKLPSHTGTTDGVDKFFILKNNTVKLTTKGYLGFYKPRGFDMTYHGGSSSGGYYYKDGDENNNLRLSNGGYINYQGLSTTEKQW